MNLYDTIAAISTPIGEGGIAVIRISGDGAFKVIERHFFKDNFRRINLDIGKIESHTIHYGYFFDDGSLVDEVLVSIFRNPNSYTGEDVIEISSHGGVFIAQKILSALFRNNIRHAEPGEFTKRAFINGKIDLSQAEAVADLIRSKTDAAHSSSIKQLEGSLSDFVTKTRQEIIDITSLVELELDFAEEGLEFVKKEQIKSKISDLRSKLENIISSFITGKIIREGVNIVIAGRPNSGKSSLFNYLLKTNRAIVSEIAGTTRDYIEESIIIKGILFNLTDTAGLRVSHDQIESEGIRRSHVKISDADLILYLIDLSESEDAIKKDIEFFAKEFGSTKSILIFSKSDLGHDNQPHVGLRISLLNDESIENLKNEMVKKITTDNLNILSDKIILTNFRHKLCLEGVVGSLSEAIMTIEDGRSGEFISVDLRNALRYLGEITGEVTNEEILNNIFGKFCIGK